MDDTELRTQRRKFRIMIRHIKINPPADWVENVDRACGDVLCEKCGLPYLDHPVVDRNTDPGVVVTCTGKYLKL